MSKGACPDCGNRVRLSWFKALCNSCNVELVETKDSRIVQAMIFVISAFIGIYVSRQGTPDILAASTEENVANNLFYFYIKIVAIVAICQTLVARLIAQYVSIYKYANT